MESLKTKYYSFFVKLRFSLGALKRGRWDAGYWRRYNFAQDKDYQFCKMASQLTAPSAAMQDWAAKNWHIPKEKIDVIANPFTPSPALLALPVNKTATHKTIFFFGRLNVLKGLVNATDAVKKILEEFPAWHFKVIGDNGPGPGPGMRMQEWMQQQLEVFAGRVQFISGYSYEALPGLIAEAEIAVLPSLFESFSYTCAEAMAAGKAVIGSAGTGMAFMENKVTGLLVNAERPGEIYAAIKKLIADDDLRYQVSINAREAITTLFSEKVVAQQYIGSYKKTIEENSRISFS